MPRTVYLTPDQADCVDHAVAERGGSCSDFLREAALFEARHGLAKLVWRSDWRWQGDDSFDRDRVFADHVRRLLSRRAPSALSGHVAVTGPAEPLLPLPSLSPPLVLPSNNSVAAAPPPPDARVMAVPSEAAPSSLPPRPPSPVVEAVTPGPAPCAPTLPAPIPAVSSTVRALIVVPARQRTVIPPPRPPSIDTAAIAKTIGRGLLLGFAIAIGWLHSVGRRDGATWRYPQGPTFGGFIAALVMAAMIPFALPMEWGRGDLSYALAAGTHVGSKATDPISEIVARSPPRQQQLVRYGLMVSGQPGNIDRIQHCVEQLRQPGRSGLCKIRVISPETAS